MRFARGTDLQEEHIHRCTLVLVTRMLVMAPRTEQAAVGTRRRVAETDSRLDCAVEAGDGPDCNNLLMTSCLFPAVPTLWLRAVAAWNVREVRLTYIV